VEDNGAAVPKAKTGGKKGATEEGKEAKLEFVRGERVDPKTTGVREVPDQRKEHRGGGLTTKLWDPASGPRKEKQSEERDRSQENKRS